MRHLVRLGQSVRGGPSMVLVNLSHEVDDVPHPSVELGDGIPHLPQLPHTHTPQRFDDPLSQVVNVVQLTELNGITHVVSQHKQMAIHLVNFIGLLTNR